MKWSQDGRDKLTCYHPLFLKWILKKVDIGKRSIQELCLTAPTLGHKGLIISVRLRVL